MKNYWLNRKEDWEDPWFAPAGLNRGNVPLTMDVFDDIPEEHSTYLLLLWTGDRFVMDVGAYKRLKRVAECYNTNHYSIKLIDDRYLWERHQEMVDFFKMTHEEIDF